VTIIEFVEQNIAAEPPERAAALKSVLTESLRAAMTLDNQTEGGCLHTMDEIRAGECDLFVPDEFGPVRALASYWASRPGYNPGWSPAHDRSDSEMM